jgi:putative tryptophan/tyrosine transport system substrate-binding protein
MLAATKTIPVVFFYTGDPVGSGFVQSLAAPGGNATGLGGLSVDLHGKQLSLLKEAMPQLTRVAVFVNSSLSIHNAVRAELDGVARRLGVQLKTVELRGPDGLDAAFASATRERSEALLLIGQPFFYLVGERLVRLSLEHKLPAMLPFHELTQAGMLMAYGSRMIDDVQRLPYFIDRILKGAKPAELPVEQPQHFYLSLNLKTAKAMALNLPRPLLLRADVLVE